MASLALDFIGTFIIIYYLVLLVCHGNHVITLNGPGSDFFLTLIAIFFVW